MRVTEQMHALKIPFQVPISPEKIVDRFAYAYLVFGDKITLIDSGVKGAETIIFDYIKNNGRNPEDIARVILSHSHPDHIGSVKAIKQATGCRVLAHAGEQDWIEDTEKQFKERPVPGFHTLVGGPVAVDGLLDDGETVDLGGDITCGVMHTPGHSRGSISLLFEGEKVMMTGDAIPLPHDMPIYDDVIAMARSLRRLRKVRGVDVLLSSWEGPILGVEPIEKRMDDGFTYLRRIHETVRKAEERGGEDLMALCRQVVSDMGLPPFAANPLVARSFAAHVAALATTDLFD